MRESKKWEGGGAFKAPPPGSYRVKGYTFTIPQTTSGITKEIQGWNDLAKQELEQSFFWHWIWCECGNPYNGDIYNITKKTRHTYHYTVRRLKRNKAQAIKLKLSEKIE